MADERAVRMVGEGLSRTTMESISLDGMTVEEMIAHFADINRQFDFRAMVKDLKDAAEKVWSAYSQSGCPGAGHERCCGLAILPESPRNGIDCIGPKIRERVDAEWYAQNVLVDIRMIEGHIENGDASAAAAIALWLGWTHREWSLKFRFDKTLDVGERTEAGMRKGREKAGNYEHDDEIRVLWTEGYGVSEIAHRTGMTPGGVSRAGKRLRLPPRT